MPRLSRLRFVNIGHAEARFDDLTLDFRDGVKRASDAVIWLRNAGGKSSILNLFFALMRPGKLNFLGGFGSAGKRARSLLDYVLEGDRAVIVAEWELDDESRRGKMMNQGPLLGGLEDDAGSETQLAGPVKYLTGAFHELAPPGRADAGSVQTLLFAARVIPDASGFTLDDLPLFIRRTDGRRTRRSLTDFKQEWHNQGLAHPIADAREVMRPVEWAAILENAQLDPDLFEQQIKMNRREGGADALFQFRDAAEFIDFFLELTLDSDHCQQVAGNLEAFRNLLARRATLLLPQHELVGGARERLEPFRLMREERAAIRYRAERAGVLLLGLTRHCQDRSTELSKWAAADSVSLKIANDAEGEARANALSLRGRAAALRFHAEVARARRFEELARTTGEQLARAKHERAIWTAAIPLRDFLVHEAEAAGHLERLNRIRAEQSPLLENVREAAGRFARALRARMAHYQDRRRKHLLDESGLRETSLQHRKNAREQELKAAGQFARADELDRRDQEAISARHKLQSDGATVSDEPPASALERWTTEGGRLAEAERLVEAEATRLQAEAERVEGELQTATRERLAAAVERTAKNGALTTAWAKRRSLESNPLLSRCLELETVNLEGMDPLMVNSRLLDTIAAVQTTAIELRLALAAGRRALDSLAANRLLPADPNVEQLRQMLSASSVRAFSGWEYLAQNRSPDEQRQFVLDFPEVADGIVVPDDDWSAATAVLVGNIFGLDRPVVIVAQGTLEGGAPAREHLTETDKRCVVGPTSDAHFNPAAGEAEYAVRQARAVENRESFRLKEQELSELNHLANELRAFREDYPLDWFVRQANAITNLDERVAVMHRHEQQLTNQRVDLVTARGMQEEAAKQFRRDAGVAALQRQKVEQYLQTHGRDDHVRQRERQECLNTVESARNTASMHEDAATECDANANTFGVQAAETSARAQEAEDKLTGITYLDATSDGDHLAAEILPDVEKLARSYKDLVAEYEGRIGNDSARFLYEAACEKKQAAWTEFNHALRRSENVDEASVRRALGTLLDYADAAQQLRQATTDEARLGTEHSRLLQDKIDSTEKSGGLKSDYSKHHPGTIPKLPSLSVATDLTPEAMDELTEQATRDAEEQDRHAQSRQREAQVVQTRHGETFADAHKFEEMRKRLVGLQASHRKILATLASETISSSPMVMPSKPLETEKEIENLEQAFPEISQETDALDGRSQNAADTLRRWVTSPRFAELHLELVERLKTESIETLEDTAATKCADLDLWAVHLITEISSIDGHRTRVANTLLDAALEGLVLMRSAERRSKLPAGLGQLSGQSFLRIRTREPAEHAERLARMHHVIDAAVATDKPPGGLVLIQRAIHALVQPVSAQVLFPDPDLPARFVPVETLTTQSGGERLTCAVLLYCTLARLRTYRRGVGNVDRGGVLVLDNPIGTASRRKFVRMQREAARAMGVQLLYTTAVHDLEALRELPAIVRLRNEQRDRHTGQRGVEIDPNPVTKPSSTKTGPGLLAAHLVRPEDPPST